MLIPWSAVFSMQHEVYANLEIIQYIICTSVVLQRVTPTQGELVRQDRSESMSGHCLLLFSYSLSAMPKKVFSWLSFITARNSS